MTTLETDRAAELQILDYLEARDFPMLILEVEQHTHIDRPTLEAALRSLARSGKIELRPLPENTEELIRRAGAITDGHRWFGHAVYHRPVVEIEADESETETCDLCEAAVEATNGDGLCFACAQSHISCENCGEWTLKADRHPKFPDCCPSCGNSQEASELRDAISELLENVEDVEALRNVLKTLQAARTED